MNTFLKNFNKAHLGVFQNLRVAKISLWLRRFDRFHPPNTPLNEIDEYDLPFSVKLIEYLSEFTGYYMTDQWEFDIVAFYTYVDKDFPGWTKLVETIKLFHSKFNKVNRYYPSTLINYDSSDESHESD